MGRLDKEKNTNMNEEMFGTGFGKKKSENKVEVKTSAKKNYSDLDKARVNISLDPRLFQSLKVFAAQQGTTLKELVSEAIEEKYKYLVK